MWLSTEVQQGSYIAAILFWGSVAWLLIMTPVAAAADHQSTFLGKSNE